MRMDLRQDTDFLSRGKTREFWVCPCFVYIMPELQNPQYCRILERIVGIFIYVRFYAHNDKNTPRIILR